MATFDTDTLASPEKLQRCQRALERLDGMGATIANACGGHLNADLLEYIADLLSKPIEELTAESDAAVAALDTPDSSARSIPSPVGSEQAPRPRRLRALADRFTRWSRPSAR
ncbi:MAG: hypothetical protein JO362_03000 [Streptomycetaceae bacterium]|nr:hypothetical protein [Streptomycetaceae bacterium]